MFSFSTLKMPLRYPVDWTLSGKKSICSPDRTCLYSPVVLCLLAQSGPAPCNPMDCSCQSPLFMGILQAKLLCPPPEDLPYPGIKPRSPALQVDSLPSQPQRKPKKTGLSSLSFLPGIFPTQELNWGLMHCRRILYQLCYQGSPTFTCYFKHFLFLRDLIMTYLGM